MAASIPSPWIVDYLVSVAEEYGGNLSAIPWRVKGTKAQLVEVSLPVSVASRSRLNGLGSSSPSCLPEARRRARSGQTFPTRNTLSGLASQLTQSSGIWSTSFPMF